MLCLVCDFFFFKQKTAYEMRISGWSSDVCSSDLLTRDRHPRPASIPEHHRLGSVQEHAVLDMILNGGSEHPAFYITALANQIFGRVRMADRFDILMNDRPFVEVSSDIMGGRTDHFLASRLGLGIGELGEGTGRARGVTGG